MATREADLRDKRLCRRERGASDLAHCRYAALAGSKVGRLATGEVARCHGSARGPATPLLWLDNSFPSSVSVEKKYAVQVDALRWPDERLLAGHLDMRLGLVSTSPPCVLLSCFCLGFWRLVLQCGSWHSS